jgi:hypothetical protein
VMTACRSVGPNELTSCSVVGVADGKGVGCVSDFGPICAIDAGTGD